MTDTAADARPHLTPRVGRRPFIAALGVGQIVSWGTFSYSVPLMAAPPSEMLTRSAYGAINGMLAVLTAALWAATGSYDAVLMATFAGSVVVVLGFWTAALVR